MYCIYMHTNTINGKAYIGYTKTSIDKRFSNHCAYARRNSGYLFHKAIRKYGVDIWDSCVLEYAETLQGAKNSEIRHIAEKKTNERGVGYNMTTGGEGNSCLGKQLSIEHRKKISDGLRRNPLTQEQRELIRERGRRRKGEKRSDAARENISLGIRRARINGMTPAQESQLKALHQSTRGSKRTQETKNKISNALIGKSRKTKLSMEQITEILKSDSTRIELARYYNVDPGTITIYKKKFKVLEE